MVRDGKPKGFFYLDQRTVDGQLGIITDTHLTPANVHDSIVYLERLDRQRTGLTLLWALSVRMQAMPLMVSPRVCMTGVFWV